MKQDTVNKSSSKYSGRLNIHTQEEEERDSPPRIMVEVQGKKMLVLVDTGASADFIDEDLIKEIDPITYEIETGNGTIECTRQAIMKIGLAGRMLEVHTILFCLPAMGVLKIFREAFPLAKIGTPAIIVYML